ncbi:Dtr1p NDAI_0C05670 [Naumovozyma dairenensis CBS 421]|uniref:Major facilitator superfamily (MFS) profile domain-containing protein n=1 Tax=Naumovozyma dairenensis (strain ATCC 10597 / BCRC 20456 / CBS 421 / NBRC 0211 / NRRL Y-12639) TaxID=1071378 RepID=G0W8W5_NAUDC|nr:hypothetical protein NDAI_0C05670 [Naumovozyma dairenensis CBS 421]CCD24226.1 hypothetical protein NDAI_0C05670 [Naumovozyma dairenensis CBS 421]
MSSSEETKEKIEVQNEQVEIVPYTCFTRGQIFLIFAIVIYIGFLGPMSGNIYIPALPLLQNEFKVNSTTINATVSVFMAVFSVGPLFWGLFADFGGRKILYIISISIMIAANVILAAVPSHIGALFAMRVVQAFGSSSVITLGAGTVTDITPPKHRGKAIAYFMMGPNIGPVIAPIIAGLILMKGDYWRWLFGFTAIMSGIGLFAIIIFLPETLRCIVGNYDPRWRKTEYLAVTTEKVEDIELVSEQPTTRRPSWPFFSDIGLQKPRSTSDEFKTRYPKPPKTGLKTYWQLIKCPPVLIASVSTSLLFTNYYAFSVSFAHYLARDYHLSPLKIGACYVCPGISMLVGSQVGGHLSDYLRSRWLKRHEAETFPLEYRLVLHIFGILMNTAGCIGFGFSISFHYHLALILMFSGLMAFGMTWCSNTTMTYLTELMTNKAAATIALSSFFRNVGAAISSAIIITLCDQMGVGWCFMGLGLVNIMSLVLIIYLICTGKGRQRKR